MNGGKGQAMTRRKLETVTLTPERAMELLEHNTMNRPLSQSHVQRIARQIIEKKWRFNGDTIKISSNNEILDGQHRLWACIEAKLPIETVVVTGVERDAFATVDTIRKPRSGGDVLALAGAASYRGTMAQALTWLLRYQRGVLTEYRAPQNRIENADIEAAFAAHPRIAYAAEQATKLRSLVNPSVLTFIYYLFANHNPALADRMMETLADPAAIGINDPFFRLRAYFTSDHHRKKDPLVTIAVAIKAANAAARGAKVQALAWRVSGRNPEAFPVLEISGRKAA